MPKQPQTQTEGSIQTLPSGSSRATIWINGSRMTKTFKRRDQAVAWLNGLAAQKDSGLTFNPARLTVSQLVTDWYRIKRTKHKPSTQNLYDRYIRLHIDPVIGKTKVVDLTPALLQSLYNQLVANGITVRPLEITHTILHQALDHAARLNIIVRNPADLVILPEPENTYDPEDEEIKVWTEDQVQAFLISLAGHRNRNLYHLALSTGMRRGEILGLQWDCIDLTAKTILVKQQSYEIPGGGWRLQTPKTKTGRRIIPIGDGMINALRDQYNQVNLLRKLIQSKTTRYTWQENDLVFPSMAGTPQRGPAVHVEFKELAVSAGLPEIRFHDLRHTAASIMLAHGIPVVDVSHILGHTKVSTTMDIYAHFLPGHNTAIASLMDRVTTPITVDLPYTP